MPGNVILGFFRTKQSFVKIFVFYDFYFKSTKYDFLWSKMTLFGIICKKLVKVRRSLRGRGPKTKKAKILIKNTPQDNLGTICNIVSPLTSNYRPASLYVIN